MHTHHTLLVHTACGTSIILHTACGYQSLTHLHTACAYQPLTRLYIPQPVCRRCQGVFSHTQPQIARVYIQIVRAYI